MDTTYGDLKREGEDKVKILHVIFGLEPEQGGPVTSVLGLTSALSQQGIRCELFTTLWKEGSADAMGSCAVPINRFDVGFPAHFWCGYSKALAKALRNRIGSGVFDIVHVHEPWHYPGFVAFHAARKHNVPYILSPRGSLQEWSLRHKAFKKWVFMKLIQGHILKFADAIHALTNEEMESFSKLGYKTPVFVIPNGINPSPFKHSPDISDFLATYPDLLGKRVILFMGRLHPIKGLDVLARSYTSLLQKFKDVALLVVGPDEDGTQKRMELILKTSPALRMTVFTGMLTGKDKLAALACADLFVMPSYSEGFSTAILEALAAGLPVVISKHCNFPEVSEYDAGFVVELNDTAMTEAIDTLLSYDQLRDRMGHNGRDLVREKYTWTGVAASMAGFYRKLIAQSCAERK